MYIAKKIIYRCANTGEIVTPVDGLCPCCGGQCSVYYEESEPSPADDIEPDYE